MAKVIEYSNGEITQRPAPKVRDLSVFEWIKLDNLRNTVASQDSLIRELLERQDRQAKWIVFLLVSWLFSGFFLVLAVVMNMGIRITIDVIGLQEVESENEMP